MSKLDPALLALLLWPAMAVSKEPGEKEGCRLAELWGLVFCPFVFFFFPGVFKPRQFTFSVAI